jgi:hypothetical protein
MAVMRAIYWWDSLNEDVREIESGRVKNLPVDFRVRK